MSYLWAYILPQRSQRPDHVGKCCLIKKSQEWEDKQRKQRSKKFYGWDMYSFALKQRQFTALVGRMSTYFLLQQNKTFPPPHPQCHFLTACWGVDLHWLVCMIPTTCPICKMKLHICSKQSSGSWPTPLTPPRPLPPHKSPIPGVCSLPYQV